MAIDVMMMLGPYPFTIDTAAYQTLMRTTGWRWPGQAQIGKRDAYQFVGREDDTISLRGVVYPQFRSVGVWQVEALRALGETGKPQRLVDGTGHILGLWLITSVRENQALMGRSGTPKKQEFTLDLKKYDDDRLL